MWFTTPWGRVKLQAASVKANNAFGQKSTSFGFSSLVYSCFKTPISKQENKLTLAQLIILTMNISEHRPIPWWQPGYHSGSNSWVHWRWSPHSCHGTSCSPAGGKAVRMILVIITVHVKMVTWKCFPFGFMIFGTVWLSMTTLDWTTWQWPAPVSLQYCYGLTDLTSFPHRPCGEYIVRRNRSKMMQPLPASQRHLTCFVYCYVGHAIPPGGAHYVTMLTVVRLVVLTSPVPYSRDVWGQNRSKCELAT